MNPRAWKTWVIIIAAAVTVGMFVFGGVKSNAADFTTTTYVSNAATDTEVKTTILDNSRYPEVTARLECSGTDVSDMVRSCALALNELCPDGGVVEEMGETPAGVLPARIEVTVACRHEPGV